jgi:trk system potassium uptake protein
MKVIIMGCGRVGEQVARLMADDNHHVTVIDYEAAALDRLGADFRGRRVLGVGFDREVLLEAGIEDADAFAATSSSDNANIVAARIARNIFHVPRVVARLYEPSRAEVYQRLGLVTISSTTWGAQRIQELLTHRELDPVMTFGDGEVVVISIETPPGWIGRAVKHINIPGEILVTAITRHDRAMLPLSGTELQADDVVHVTLRADALDRIEEWLGG